MSFSNLIQQYWMVIGCYLLDGDWLLLLLPLSQSRDDNGVFSGIRPVLSLMGWGSILINEFGTGLKFFLKPRMGSGIAPIPLCPVPIIYKINLI